MAVFVVLADKSNTELGRKIATLYPADHYEITDSQWLISADTIPQTIAEQLEIRTGKFGRAIVIRTTGSAAGWHTKTVWEWITQKATGL
jgi:hypothetical protein